MSVLKKCSRPGCGERAVAQLTYAYALSQVEISPVADDLPVGAYVLCQTHLDRLSVPKGWKLIRTGSPTLAQLSEAEIESLAEEVRRVGLGLEPQGTETSLSRRPDLVMLASRAHLRVVADSASMSVKPTRN